MDYTELTPTAIVVADMDWQPPRAGVRFCNALATKMLNSCIERTATRVVAGRMERRDYYRPGIPDTVPAQLRSVISTSDAMLNAKGPYKLLRDSDVWRLLRDLSVAVAWLNLSRAVVARTECVYRWRAYTNKEELPDDETLLAFEAIIELGDYHYAQEFARQHTRTDAWKGVVRLPVNP